MIGWLGGENMDLKLLEETSYRSDGFGSGSGEVITEVYECPCQKGKVYYEKENIPGFRTVEIFSDCKECKENFDFGRGTAKAKENTI